MFGFHSAVTRTLPHDVPHRATAGRCCVCCVCCMNSSSPTLESNGRSSRTRHRSYRGQCRLQLPLGYVRTRRFVWQVRASPCGKCQNLHVLLKPNVSFVAVECARVFCQHKNFECALAVKPTAKWNSSSSSISSITRWPSSSLQGLRGTGSG